MPKDIISLDLSRKGLHPRPCFQRVSIWPSFRGSLPSIVKSQWVKMCLLGVFTFLLNDTLDTQYPRISCPRGVEPKSCLFLFSRSILLRMGPMDGIEDITAKAESHHMKPLRERTRGKGRLPGQQDLRKGNSQLANQSETASRRKKTLTWTSQCGQDIEGGWEEKRIPV